MATARTRSLRIPHDMPARAAHCAELQHERYFEKLPSHLAPSRKSASVHRDSRAMTAFLFLIVVLLAIWIARSASKIRKNESMQAQLTPRIFNLEQELKKVRAPASEAVIPSAAALQPVPPVPAERVITQPALAPEPEIPVIPLTPPCVHKAGTLSFRKLLNLEETLGTNWLNKLGIIILVIGVALFLAYEMRELGPVGKVAVGYAVSLAMLGA